jgi:hypothetical protein
MGGSRAAPRHFSLGAILRTIFDRHMNPWLASAVSPWKLLAWSYGFCA